MDFFADKYEYPNEFHLLEANDGFILSLFRVPSAPAGPVPAPNGPVLVLTGALSDGVDLMRRGPEESFVFYLANQGFDVWVMNPRGSPTSSAHVDHSPDGNPDTCLQADPYWNPCQLGVFNTHDYFNSTFDEIGNDIVTFYEYISSQVGLEQGNSIPNVRFGSACYLVEAAFSLHPEYFDEMVPVSVQTSPMLTLSKLKGFLPVTFVSMLPLFRFMDTLGLGLLPPNLFMPIVNEYV